MSNHKLKILNKIFGKLLVLREIPERDKFCNVYWECKCECGNLIIIRGCYLTCKSIKSCGCDAEKEKHGMSNSKIYGVWNSMVRRCTSQTNQAYTNYGGRGIKCCERWANSFNNFLEDIGKSYVGI